jgi:hypothetical protein
MFDDDEAIAWLKAQLGGAPPYRRPSLGVGGAGRGNAPDGVSRHGRKRASSLAGRDSRERDAPEVVPPTCDKSATESVEVRVAKGP